MAGTYVRVLYNYTYQTSSGLTVSIVEGEECLLLKKSNNDWWRVVKNGERSPIYVPAQYVEEIPKGAVLQKKYSYEETEEKTPSCLKEDCPTLDSLIPAPDETAAETESEEKVVDKNANSEDSLHQDVAESKEDTESANSKDSESLRKSQDSVISEEEPEYAVVASNSEGNTAEDGEDEDDLPDYVNLPYSASTASKDSGLETSDANSVEKDDQPMYENLEELRAMRTQGDKPPEPEENTEPVKQYSENWEQYNDEESGRPYYYNKETKDTSWKLPRGITVKVNNVQGNSDDASQRLMRPVSFSESRVNSFGTTAVLNTGSGLLDGTGLPSHVQQRHSLPPQTTSVVPDGWSEETDDSGDTVFINDETKEKWYRSIDQSGKLYYYKENTNESAWTLPETTTAVPEETDSTGDSTQDDSGIEVKPPPVRSNWHDGHPTEDSAFVTPNPIYSSGQGRRSHNTNQHRALKEMRGPFFRTKLTENGKKIKKSSWIPCYIVSKPPRFLIYKDTKSAQAKEGNPDGKPETVLDLTNAKIDFINREKDKSLKKSVIQVCTAAGTQFLLHNDENMTALHEWYISLTYNIQHLGSVSKGSSSDSLDQMDMQDEESKGIFTRRKTKKPTSATNSLERSGTLDDLSPQEKNIRIKDKLRNFFLRGRPTLEALQAQGIYKDSVFGADLLKLCERQKTNVPKFVTQCIAAIEKRGLETDGIYRISGNLAQIQKLRLLVDINDTANYDSPDWEIHVLTGSLKLFFRELKEPLFPSFLFDKFVTAVNHRDSSSKVKAFKDVLKLVPRQNKETMKELFRHLNRVVEYHAQNRMQPQNVAIVFGPTLMWQTPDVKTARKVQDSDGQNMAVTMVLQTQIVEFMLIYFKQLF